jgi:hypothetical protein
MSETLTIHQSLADYSGNLAVLEKMVEVPGDVLEIGALTGGGTRALGRWAGAHGRTTIVVDVFSPGLDWTRNADNRPMSEIYDEVLGGANNWRLFAHNTVEVQRMIVYRMRSSEVAFHPDQRFCFAFIDGSHAYEDVKADARLVWPFVSPDGCMGFDDYGHDLPGVERAVDEFVAEAGDEVAYVRSFGYQRYVFKRPATMGQGA